MARQYNAIEIGSLLRQGINIMEWIRGGEGGRENSPTAIAYSYDAQAGSYTAAIADPAVRGLKQRAGVRLAALFDEISPLSILDAGTGEATTLAPALHAMKRRPTHVLGFDISLSRLLFARRRLSSEGDGGAELFTGTLDRIPLASSSVDLVFTFHALEPNRGREEEILRELLRVTRCRLVMVEPSYELGGAATRARIDRMGYVCGLPETLERLGHPARLVERWGLDANPANEAALIVVDKPAKPVESSPLFVSPLSGKPLLRLTDCCYCPEDGHAFPILAGIPCLVSENALLVSKLGEFQQVGTVADRT